MKRVVLAAVTVATVTACGGVQNVAAAPVAPAATSGGPAAGSDVVPLVTPDVDLRDAQEAVVGTHVVPMDGIAEGLAWPALRAAVARKPGDHAPLTIAVARSVPMNTVMRAVWTLRDAALRVQTPDPDGTPRVLELRPKPDVATRATDPECHLAVFVASNGDLRVAAPGGPHLLTGPDAPATLARALSSERARCSIRYVAFGAESADASWSSVFDVARAVDRDKSAGDARYVLGEPVRTAAH